MEPIWWIFKHNFEMLKKSKVRLILLVGIPIVSILIYFFAYGSSVGNDTIEIGVANQDKGTYTTALTTLLKSEKNVKVTEVSKAQGEKELLGGQKEALIIMEQGANDSLELEKPAHFRVKALQGEDTAKSIERMLASQLEKLVKIERMSEGKDFNKSFAIYQNEQLTIKNVNLSNESEIAKSMSAQIIGFFCMMLLYAAGSLGELLLKEREEGTFYRLMSTPISSRQYILGTALFSLVTLLAEIVLCLLAMRFVFQIDPGTSLGSLFVILSLFAVFAISISLAFSFVFKSRRSLSAIQTTIFTLSTLLSGALIPIQIMPKFMQKMAEFMPQFWVMDAVSKLQQEGSLLDLGLNILVLLGYTLFFISLASYRYTRNREIKSFI
ncbi:ABC transporter permease [Listeria aquatica]|uniref:Antibiotic transport system permease n=1 Tax=Listeria aquatica FSL S10-1188 TaxID=1265818 RepID=W7B9I5_9LIST|nr:ABC transporter permease [Listeria aquatica]EUJ21350.1 antibiotic transport system permease [Listeria aquatica FSL S10-1188]